MGIENLVNKLNKDAGKNVISGATEILDLPRIPFGSLSLDLESGGGVPVGRITSFVGEESTGKSVLALKVVAEFQKKYPDQDILWIDAEGAFDWTWAKALGVDVDDPKLYVMRPEWMEQAYDAALLATEENVGLIIIDSLAAMSPKDEMEESIEKFTVGLAARLHRKMFRKFQSAVNDAGNDVPSTLIYINHLNEKVGGQSRPGMPPALMEPGGRALRFFPSLKVMLKTGDVFPKPKPGHDEDTAPKAKELKFHITKNKTAPPLRRGHVWFYFDTLDSIRPKGSFDRIEEIIRYALKYGVVTRVNKSVYAMPDPDTGEAMTFRGSGAVATKIREDLRVQAWVEKELAQRVREGLLESDTPLSKDDEDGEDEGVLVTKSGDPEKA